MYHYYGFLWCKLFWRYHPTSNTHTSFIDIGRLGLNEHVDLCQRRNHGILNPCPCRCSKVSEILRSHSFEYFECRCSSPGMDSFTHFPYSQQYDLENRSFRSLESSSCPFVLNHLESSSRCFFWVNLYFESVVWFVQNDWHKNIQTPTPNYCICCVIVILITLTIYHVWSSSHPSYSNQYQYQQQH